VQRGWTFSLWWTTLSGSYLSLDLLGSSVSAVATSIGHEAPGGRGDEQRVRGRRQDQKHRADREGDEQARVPEQHERRPRPQRVRAAGRPPLAQPAPSRSRGGSTPSEGPSDVSTVTCHP
jgi:hypothetical protein